MKINNTSSTPSSLKRMIGLLAILACAVVFAEPARAETFAQKHPRRAQVLRRDRKQVDANNAAAVSGKITDKQARKLDREDANIRRQEQRDARENGGHITKGEQAQLNREENSVNRQRNRDEQVDAAAKTGQ